MASDGSEAKVKALTLADSACKALPATIMLEFVCRYPKCTTHDTNAMSPSCLGISPDSVSCMPQVHSTLKHVEYKGEIMELSRSLLQLPAGGQVLLSDTTFQRIGGRLHEVKLPALQLPRARNSVDGPRGSLEGRSRHTFEGQLRQKVEGQSRQNLDGGLGQSSPGSSRRSSMDSTVKLMVSTLP